MSMEDLLKGILGGAYSGSARGRQDADPLSDLLKGILGGASPVRRRSARTALTASN